MVHKDMVVAVVQPRLIMKILSWNCRGLGNPRTIQDLYLLVKDKKPKIVFLMETKQLTKKFDAIKRKLGFIGCFVVDARGCSGGLALLWNQDVNLEVLNFTQHHISVWLMSDDGVRKWMLTGFYGHPKVSKRNAVWGLLSSLKPSRE
ncbi:hypothetical protein CIPAW_16G004600 [Carya illinoinensis]|uniref:Endonuclease/exonuclease/phosphatase domain-containing protein n=1 Tax=Carya illinoinensis TaxID=32201 RepID=A0A8T1N537_CARIL|nr:hypothetical protein CIPAW_16G004600 [Carya illinoinensis]